MKRILCSLLLVMMIVTMLSGCDILTISRKCVTCDRNKATMHRVIGGDSDVYVCVDCRYYLGPWGRFYAMRTVQANCYYCKRDAKCNLVNIGRQGDPFDRYMAVCDSCKAFQDHYATSPVK